MSEIKIRLTQEELTQMNSKKSFGPDLTLGKIGEGMARQYFEQIGGEFIRESEEKNEELKKFDFEISLKYVKWLIEVKTDTYCIPKRYLENKETGLKIVANGRDNGNMFVEFSSRKNDSGIISTESDLWVNIFHHYNEIWIIRVSKLREIIKNNNFEIFYNAGDRNSETHGYLIPRELFREHFEVVEYERVVINQ
jgi:hypothetical protein